MAIVVFSPGETLLANNNISCGQIYKSGTRVKIAKGWKYQITQGKKNWVQFTKPDLEDQNWKQLKKMPLDFSDLGIKNSDAGSTVWLRCYLELNGRAPDGMGLFMGKIAYSDELYFNGVLVGKTGSPDQGLSDIEKKRMYPLPGNLWRDGINTLVIRVHGVNNDSFIKKIPEITNHLEIAKKLYIADVSQIVFSIVYMLVSVFFALFFVFFLKEIQNLYFSLFCLFLGLYHIIRTQIRYDMFDSFENSFHTELLVLFLLPMLFSEFYHTLIKIKRNLVFKITYVFYGILILTCVFIGDKAKYWNTLIQINLIMILAISTNLGISFFKEYKNHNNKLKYLLYGFSIVIPAMLMDIFSALGWHDLPRFTVYGFFFFLATVSYQLSNSIFNLYNEIKNQEKGLLLLEKKRTRSLFNISNEFNSILEGLKKSLETNKASNNSKKKSTAQKIKKSELNSMDRSVCNLENIFRDSNMLVLLENQEYNIRRVSFNLPKMISETVQKALIATEQPKKRVKIEMQTETKELQGDPDLMSTAIYHLVENSLLYSLGQVHVIVESELNGDTVIHVRDEGPGIPADMQTSVLQKFIRDNQEKNIPGSGIGLTIVDLIMQYTDGTLSLDNGKGYYCQFTCTFPQEAGVL